MYAVLLLCRSFKREWTEVRARFLLGVAGNVRAKKL
jgi:hypothetical protein